MAQNKKKSKAKAKPKAKAVKAKKTASPKNLKKAVTLTKALKKASVISGKSAKVEITPLDDRIVVEVETVTKTSGGLYIPSTVGDRPQQGKVIAVGRGHLSKKGRVRPMDVRPGDTVMFAPVAGVDMTLTDQEVLILRESDILGILEG